MAYYSLHAYDADVWLRSFLGLRQQDESLNLDPRFATDVLNVETPNGVLQPHAGYDVLPGDLGQQKAETIARFYRRYYTGNGSKHWLVCAAGGKLFYTQEGSDVGWIEIQRPSGSDPFTNNVWSWCTYEDNPISVGHTIDVLLMSNPDDGMIMLSPPDRITLWGDIHNGTTGYLWGELYDNETSEPEYTPGEMTWGDVMSAKWQISTVKDGSNNNLYYGVIERYAERIWAGGIQGRPATVIYSAPYDPTDWTQNDEIPEDGAGENNIPSWDGDSVTALKAFGDRLIIFKEHKVWQVYGTNPGEYVFKEQYGGGCPFPNTIAVDVERIYFADVDGLSVYDGMSVQPFQRKLIEPLWRNINRAAMDQMCAALFNNRYYLSVPMGTSPVNNAVIVLNLEEGTILFYDDMKIESLLSTYENIYATSTTLPGKVLELNYDSWVCGKANGGKTKWVSPWMDFGYKNIQKGGFDLYFTPEVQTEPVTLTISIQTEKKTKVKEYTIRPLTDEQKEAGKESRNKKIHFGGSGRRFRIMIETGENIHPWRLVGGLHLVVETDPD